MSWIRLPVARSHLWMGESPEYIRVSDSRGGDCAGGVGGGGGVGNGLPCPLATGGEQRT